jgi:hypothetical protein
MERGSVVVFGRGVRSVQLSGAVEVIVYGVERAYKRAP